MNQLPGCTDGSLRLGIDLMRSMPRQVGAAVASALAEPTLGRAFRLVATCSTTRAEDRLPRREPPARHAFGRRRVRGSRWVVPRIERGARLGAWASSGA